MSLPPGFLDELRTRVSMGQVAGRKVMWDPRKSNQGKGDLWAPCPFHQEKTASFHVDDRKGYYYCFGCHAKGDAITFVRETENVSFMEAVEILAGEAGMQMPARDPKAKEKADRLTELAEVMEKAVQHFRLQLKTGGAAEARAYLDRRGLSAAALDRWEIGFAPDAWQGLWDALIAKGVKDELILAAGLAKPSQKGGKPYDTFRGRIIFPIRDARGRCIAFGGRAMDPNDNAKYLNSPETELFDKGRSLFNHGPAREAAGKGQPLIVAEGYMDVIALAEAGFTGAVAPLGTAVTETQMQMLWRIAPEPILALDGDTAGLRAAMRVIDLALPLLEAGKSLRFAIMPSGQDPDDVLRASGPEAMRALIDGAQPLVQLLWRRETEGKTFDSPERKSALDKSLREAIKRIPDANLRSHYGQELKNLRWALFAPPRRAPSGPGKPRAVPQKAVAGTKHSALAGHSRNIEDRLREEVILAVLSLHPELIEAFADTLEDRTFSTPELDALRQSMLNCNTFTPELGGAPLERLLAQSHIRVVPAIRNKDDSELARLCISGELAKLDAKRGAEAEIREAVQDITDLSDENVTWRLAEAAEAQARATQGLVEDKTEFDTAASGARVNRSEREAFDALLKGIKYSKTDRTQR
ncbi:MAG: DNA primase [Pseudomonadota bacterium]